MHAATTRSPHRYFVCSPYRFNCQVPTVLSTADLNYSYKRQSNVKKEHEERQKKLARRPGTTGTPRLLAQGLILPRAPKSYGVLALKMLLEFFLAVAKVPCQQMPVW
jgi:hypothetical protein